MNIQQELARSLAASLYQGYGASELTEDLERFAASDTSEDEREELAASLDSVLRFWASVVGIPLPDADPTDRPF